MPSERAEESAEKRMLRPKGLSIRRLLLGHFHWKCLLCSLLIAVCAVHVGYCQVHGPKDHFHSLSHSPGPCSHGYNLIPMALGALVYMIYLSECWHYRAQLCSLPRMGANQIGQLAEAMRRAVPVVWWKSVCYHYLRRTRQVTRYRNGDVVTRSQVYYERVNSQQSGNVFLYDQCGYKDISKELANLDHYPMVHLRFTKGFVFACLQAANEFEEQRMRFFSENEMLDDYMEVLEGLDLANLPFIERALVFPERQPGGGGRRKLLNWLTPGPRTARSVPDRRTFSTPFWLSPWIFWPASLLLLSWPMRLLAECRTGHVHLQVAKLFGTNYLSPSSANYTGPLTRTSTMDSHELELANRQNYLMVPSYSQAILLDPYQQETAIHSSGLFRQLFSSPRRNLARPLVSHYAPLPLDYGSFRANGKDQKRRGEEGGGGGSHSSAASIGPTRSHSIGCFGTNSNEGVANNEGNGRHLRRHLPRPSTLTGQRRPSQPPRSITISDGMGGQREEEEEGGGWWSDRIPLLAQNHQRPPHHLEQQRPTMAVFPMLAEHSAESPPDEAPPPYEAALRYCSPIYQRLRQSVHSISSMFSRSGSRRDLRQISMTADGPSSPCHS